MAEPGRSFYPLRQPKSADYLHYWSANAELQFNINGLLNMGKMAALQSQLKNFQAIQANSFGQVNEQSLNQLSQIFDMSVNQEGLQAAFSNNTVIGEANGNLASSLEDALSLAKNINIDNAVSEIKNFAQQLNQVVSNQLSPHMNQDAVKAIGDAMLLEYAKQASIAGKSSKGLTDRNRGLVSQQIIRDILANNNNRFFKISPSSIGADNMTMDNSLKKMIAAAAALQTFANGSTGIKQAAVKNSRGKFTGTAKGDNEVLSILVSKVSGSLQYMNTKISQAASVEAVLAPSEKLFEQLSLFDDRQYGTVTSGKTMIVTKQMATKDSKKQILGKIQQAKASIERKTSDSNISIAIGEGNASANINFDIENGKNISNATNISNSNIGAVTISNTASLIKILLEDLSLSSSDLQSMIQLLAGHGNDGADGEWESIKQQILYMSFISLLATAATDSLSSFMISNNQVISVSYILSQIMNNQNDSFINQIQVAGEGLNRSSYLFLNKWVEPSPANPISAVIRSNALWSAATSMINNTKLSIMLNLATFAGIF